MKPSPEKSIILIPFYASPDELGFCQNLIAALNQKSDHRLKDYQLIALNPILMTARSPSASTPHLHPISLRAHVMRDYLIDLCRSFGKQGYRNFICISTCLHPKTLTVVEEASRSLSSNGNSWIKNIFHRLQKKPRLILLNFSGGLLTKDKVNQSKEVIFADQEIDLLLPHAELAFQKNNRSSAFTSFYYFNPLHRSMLRVWILVILLSLILTVWLYGALNGWLGDMGGVT